MTDTTSLPAPTGRDALKVVWLPFIVSRLLLIVIATFSVCWLGKSANEVEQMYRYPVWLGGFTHYDSLHYLSIATIGHQYTPGQMGTVAFFPLFAWLIGGVGRLFGGSDLAMAQAGFFLTNAFLLAALVVFYRLLRLDFSHTVARRTCWYVCVAPLTLFYSAIYPMSLSLLLAVGAYYLARRKQWLWAGLLAGLQSLTRMEGFLILLPLLCELLQQGSGTAPPGTTVPGRIKWALQNNQIRREMWMLTPIVLFFGGWCVYLYFRFGDPFAFRTVQQWWPGAKLGYAGFGLGRSFVDYSVLLGCVAASILGMRRLRPLYAVHLAVYTLLLLGLGITGAHSFASAPRYALNLFPAFALLALLSERHNDWHDMFLVACAFFAALTMMVFSLGFWVA